MILAISQNAFAYLEEEPRRIAGIEPCIVSPIVKIWNESPVSDDLRELDYDILCLLPKSR